MTRAASIAVLLLSLLGFYVCALTVQEILDWHHFQASALYLGILLIIAAGDVVTVIKSCRWPTRRSIYSAMLMGWLLLSWSLLPLCA
jgi:hypothetical protein